MSRDDFRVSIFDFELLIFDLGFRWRPTSNGRMRCTTPHSPPRALPMPYSRFFPVAAASLGAALTTAVPHSGQRPLTLPVRS